MLTVQTGIMNMITSVLVLALYLRYVSLHLPLPSRTILILPLLDFFYAVRITYFPSGNDADYPLNRETMFYLPHGESLPIVCAIACMTTYSFRFVSSQVLHRQHAQLA